MWRVNGSESGSPRAPAGASLASKPRWAAMRQASVSQAGWPLGWSYMFDESDRLSRLQVLQVEYASCCQSFAFSRSGCGGRTTLAINGHDRNELVVASRFAE